MDIQKEADFCEFVVSETKRLGMTTYQLADKIGIKGSNLQQILDGRNIPRLTTMLKILNVIGAKIEIQ